MEHGALVIAGDPEHAEEYLCEILDASSRGHDPPPDPIVRVLRILHYPAQRAIMQPDVAHEVPPLGAGCVCRLPVLRLAAPGEYGMYDSYESSCAAALDRAIANARSDGERAILARHAEGVIRRKRIVVSG